MAEQNSITNYSSYLECPDVKLEGGIIDNVSIGSLTPSDGSFLTLSSGSVDLTGGLIDGIDIGSIVPGDGTFVNLNTAGANITGGTIDGTDIGTTSPATGIFSSISVDSGYTLPSVDGSPNQILKTDGGGTVTWQDDAVSIFSMTSGATGSITFPNGLIMKWGSFTMTSNPFIYTFPAVFPTAGWQAILCEQGGSSPVGYGSISASQIINVQSTGLVTVSYVAFGN